VPRAGVVGRPETELDEIRLDLRGRLALPRGRIRQAAPRLPIIAPHGGFRARTTLNLRWIQPADKTRKTVHPAKTILVVEDDRLNMRLFHDLLTSQGFTTLEAASGESALALAAATPPDLMLLDIQLPGMSGIELVRRFKEDRRLRAVPIVAVTALALRQHEAMIRASGCDAYVTKPFAIAELMSVVRNHLPAEAADEAPGAADEARPWSVSPAFSLAEDAPTNGAGDDDDGNGPSRDELN
jgi:two-component system, cell cycle response regulator DivK